MQRLHVTIFVRVVLSIVFLEINSKNVFIIGDNVCLLYFYGLKNHLSWSVNFMKIYIYVKHQMYLIGSRKSSMVHHS